MITRTLYQIRSEVPSQPLACAVLTLSTNFDFSRDMERASSGEAAYRRISVEQSEHVYKAMACTQNKICESNVMRY